MDTSAHVGSPSGAGPDGTTGRRRVPRLGRAVADVLDAPVAARWYARWGARPDELTAPPPGDDLVPEPVLGHTRAVTVAPVEQVWPCVARIGQGRGGLYGHDGPEDLVRCGIPRRRPHPARAPGRTSGRVRPAGIPLVSPPTTPVLAGADPRPPHEVGPASSGTASTWQWSPRPEDGGRRTRPVVRRRLLVPPSPRLPWSLVEAVGSVVDRRVLRGIARRPGRR